MTAAVAMYKNALHQDNMCVEAIACIATHYFYSDQPEIALKFYRYVHQNTNVNSMINLPK
jgi:tetratricopeptide repeat protein 8